MVARVVVVVVIAVVVVVIAVVVVVVDAAVAVVVVAVTLTLPKAVSPSLSSLNRLITQLPIAKSRSSASAPEVADTAIKVNRLLSSNHVNNLCLSPVPASGGGVP